MGASVTHLWRQVNVARVEYPAGDEATVPGAGAPSARVSRISANFHCYPMPKANGLNGILDEPTDTGAS